MAGVVAIGPAACELQEQLCWLGLFSPCFKMI